MAKLSSSALRSAAASAREKSSANAGAVAPVEVAPVVEKPKAEAPKPEKAAKKPEPRAKKEPEPKAVEEKPVEAPEKAFKGVLSSKVEERKTVHVNLLLTPSMVEKIEAVTTAGGFRSKNATVEAILEAFFEENRM